MRAATSNNTHNHILGVLSKLDKRETEWAIQFLTRRLSMDFPINENQNKNFDRLKQELHNITTDNSLKTSGMEDISDETLNGASTFVNQCPNDDLMMSASFSPRQNGTLLLYWNIDNFVASVNIGDNLFSYAMFSPTIGYEDSGEGNVQNVNDINSFYDKLKKANERLKVEC